MDAIKFCSKFANFMSGFLVHIAVLVYIKKQNRCHQTRFLDLKYNKNNFATGALSRSRCGSLNVPQKLQQDFIRREKILKKKRKETKRKKIANRREKKWKKENGSKKIEEKRGKRKREGIQVLAQLSIRRSYQKKNPIVYVFYRRGKCH